VYITVSAVNNITENIAIIMLSKNKGTKERLNRTQDPKQRTETKRNSRTSADSIHYQRNKTSPTENLKEATASRGIKPHYRKPEDSIHYQRNRTSRTEHRRPASATRGLEPPQLNIRRKHPLPEQEPPRKKTGRQHPLREDSKLPDRTQEDSISYQRTRTSTTEHRKP
jgi:hypothetical protein